MYEYSTTISQEKEISKFDILVDSIDEVDSNYNVECDRVWVNDVHIQANVISISTGMLHFEKGNLPFTDVVSSMNLRDLKSLRFSVGSGDEFKIYRFKFDI